MEILIPLGFFAMCVAMVWAPLHFRAKREAEMLTAVRLSIEKGQPLDPGILESLTPKRDPYVGLKIGVVLIGASVALVVFSQVMGTIAEAAKAPILGAAAFPFFIGIALVGLHIFLPRPDRPSR